MTLPWDDPRADPLADLRAWRDALARYDLEHPWPTLIVRMPSDPNPFPRFHLFRRSPR